MKSDVYSLSDEINKTLSDYNKHILSCIDTIKDLMKSNNTSEVDCEDEFEDEIYGVHFGDGILDCQVIKITYNEDIDNIDITLRIDNEYEDVFELDNCTFSQLDTYYDLMLQLNSHFMEYEV